ncbi:hypothetical protein EHQ53_17120 [Leptospira langatensis]|uniref:Uncharacterized protein n=1 Tax=Leptospira langatensis TaxID=2484983 RepID=A0A5F1ZND6_9LEPT|nr:hypothetical protein [Leptospira langatensis]TGK05358.1 hypothetical protein EHO57_01360 [Leptospira langatensis]TGL38494.1 hypothetical protein EHQ53_17120 [Leptospira langatensis]
MDKFFKTCFLLIYIFGIVFLIILDQRWGKKTPIPRPSFGEEGRNCQSLECILREKNLVLGALDRSWNQIRDKRLFPDWESNSSKK